MSSATVLTLIGDKNFRGKKFEAELAAAGALTTDSTCPADRLPPSRSLA
jgi:hypothetical protein